MLVELRAVVIRARARSYSYAELTFAALLEFIADQLHATNPRRQPGVFSIYDQRDRGYAARTINQRLAAISGFYHFHVSIGTLVKTPIPSRLKTIWPAEARKRGLLGHVYARRWKRAATLKIPRELPRALEPPEVEALVGSLRSCRDKALALCLFGGLRVSEALGIKVRDVDFDERQLRVWGKGAKERVVPVAPEVISLIHQYLLHERPDSSCSQLFLVLKGPRRGQPLSAEGVRSIFRYHRAQANVARAHPHSLRHTYALNLAEAGIDPLRAQGTIGTCQHGCQSGLCAVLP
ncbi:MAG: tyrosine-type recombinase/integrase [Bacillota bacterium]